MSVYTKVRIISAPNRRLLCLPKSLSKKAEGGIIFSHQGVNHIAYILFEDDMNESMTSIIGEPGTIGSLGSLNHDDDDVDDAEFTLERQDMLVLFSVVNSLQSGQFHLNPYNLSHYYPFGVSGMDDIKYVSIRTLDSFYAMKTGYNYSESVMTLKDQMIAAGLIPQPDINSEEYRNSMKYRIFYDDKDINIDSLLQMLFARIDASNIDRESEFDLSYVIEKFSGIETPAPTSQQPAA